MADDRATSATQAKLLEGLLERMEEQEMKSAGQKHEFEEKIAQQDEKILELNQKISDHRDDLSAKDEELAAQAKEIAALRERDAERDAQIATLRERLQARDDDERLRRALQVQDKTSTGEGGDAEREHQQHRRASSAAPPENKVTLRADGNTLMVEGNLNVKGKIFGDVYSLPTSNPTESQAPTQEPTLKPTLRPTPEPTLKPTLRPTPEPTPEPTPYSTSWSEVCINKINALARPVEALPKPSLFNVEPLTQSAACSHAAHPSWRVPRGFRPIFPLFHIRAGAGGG